MAAIRSERSTASDTSLLLRVEDTARHARDGAGLRIAIVAPPWFEVPPRSYGGIEDVCHSLVEGLRDRGHDVTLVSSGGASWRAGPARTFAEPPEGLGGPDAPLIEAVHAARAARAIATLGPFDVVHDHSVVGPLNASADVPTVVTAHGPVDGVAGDLYEALGDRIHLVAISAAQRASRPRLPWADVISNGIRVEDFPFAADKGNYLLFLGRIHPDKAPHLAIDTARAVGVPLVIAAKCSEPRERDYFEQAIAPRLGRGVEWIGEVDRDTKATLLRDAMALLFPIAWDEPFGLVMVEAMACGTPVIAMRRGAAPEVVLDGVTGFLRSDPDDLPAAVRALDRIDPGECRRHVERRFGATCMVEAYERRFVRLASERSALPAR